VAVAGAGVAAAIALALLWPSKTTNRIVLPPPPAVHAPAIAWQTTPVRIQTVRPRSARQRVPAQDVSWQPAGTDIQIAIPAEAIFPPGALPAGFQFIADRRRASVCGRINLKRRLTHMKYTLICAVVTASCVFAQPEVKQVFAMQGGIIAGGSASSNTSPVQGAPYSATIVNESVQTLADGNRIVQNTAGSTARDSQGRTRQDMPLPPLGNLSAANAPHMVLIQDPVAQTTYSLNLTDKTAHKLGLPPMPPPPGTATSKVKMLMGAGATGAVAGAFAGPGPVVMTAPVGVAVAGMKETFFVGKNDPAETKTEDLGSQTMEGVTVQGVRTTRTIPAGEIGNDKPIDMVTEVWASPDLKTVVYSKRSDPRMGDQTFRLTNIVRSEPDASLFTIPADFKIVDGSQPGQDTIFYRSNQ
jgi:hypothetical protein